MVLKFYSLVLFLHNLRNSNFINYFCLIGCVRSQASPLDGGQCNRNFRAEFRGLSHLESSQPPPKVVSSLTNCTCLTRLEWSPPPVLFFSLQNLYLFLLLVWAQIILSQKLIHLHSVTIYLLSI